MGLIVFSTAVAYFGAPAMDQTRRPEIPDRRRRAALIAGVGANLGVLGFFKYFNFFVDSLVGLGQAVGLNRHGRGKTFRNVIITFLLGGLWHGASWNFLLWGAITPP